MNTNITRIPRPLGVTIQCRSLTTSADKQNEILKIKNHILNQYFLNNQTINNIPITIDQVAKYLQLTYMYIIKFMYKRLGYMQGMTDKDDGSETDILLSVLKNEIFKKALNHSQIADNQVSTMLKSQKNGYKPFISSTVNQAISNTFAADKSLMEFYRLLDKGTPNAAPNNSLHFHVPNPKSDILTTESALALMAQNQPIRLLTDGGLKEDLKAQYGITSLPEVRANYQEGVGTDKPLTEDIPVKIHTKKSNKDKHKERREKELKFVDTDEIE